MVTLCRAVEEHVAQVAADHNSYVSKSLAQHCFAIAAPDVQTGLAICLSVVEWCQGHQFSPEIASLLDANHLKVKCSASVHYVSAARKQQLGDMWIYEGNDVSAAVKLSRRGLPNAVALSEAAMACLTSPQIEGLVVSQTNCGAGPSGLSVTVYMITRTGRLESSSNSSTPGFDHTTKAGESLGSRGVLSQLLEPQAAILGIEPGPLEDTAWIFFIAYKTLLRPLAQQEFASVERHLERAFGISKNNRLEQLALRCLMRHVTVSNEVLSGRSTPEEPSTPCQFF
jgi:hypothetical protein